MHVSLKKQTNKAPHKAYLTAIPHLPTTTSPSKIHQLVVKKQSLQGPFLNSENHPIHFSIL